MLTLFFYKPLLPGIAMIALLSGCASTKTVKDHNEEFGASDVFSHSFAGTDKASCEAARRALLSQGYAISEAKHSFIKGRRKFQPQIDVHVEIEFSVVCASDSKGSNSTTVFANAVRDRYSLKKSSTSASIGVGGIGSVSLPFGESDDSLVKVASETIPTGKFYDRFFQLVERYFDDSSVGYDDNVDDLKMDLPPIQTMPTVQPAQAAQPVPTIPSTQAIQTPSPVQGQSEQPTPSVQSTQPVQPVKQSESGV